MAPETHNCVDLGGVSFVKRTGGHAKTLADNLHDSGRVLDQDLLHADSGMLNNVQEQKTRRVHDLVVAPSG